MPRMRTGIFDPGRKMLTVRMAEPEAVFNSRDVEASAAAAQAVLSWWWGGGAQEATGEPQ